MSTVGDVVRVWPRAEARCRVCHQLQQVTVDGCLALVVPHQHRGAECVGGRLTPAEVGRDIS